jgi:hypothetical protein
MTMTAHKAIFGLSVVCAMTICAVLAQGAGASGETGVTCKFVIGGAQFGDEHCKTSKAGGEGRMHESWGAGVTTTEGHTTNKTTETGKQPAVLKATIGGLETIIQATDVTSTSTIENLTSVDGRMYVTGKTNTIEFTGVTVTNRSCEFFGIQPGTGTKQANKVETQPLDGSTKEQAFGVVKFEPQTAGGKLAEFELTGASCPEALKGLYPIFGSVLSNAAEGATLPLEHSTVTGEPTPKLRLKNAATGPLAGLEGKFTIRTGVSGTATSGWNPLSLT